MAVLLFLNLKGGVAKTTTAVAVAECLALRAAKQGGKVLLIDADHQCAASELLLGEGSVVSADKNRRTLHDLLAAMLDESFDGRAGTFARYLVPKATRIRDLKSVMFAIPCSVRIDAFQTNMAKGKRGFSTIDEFQKAWRRSQASMERWLQEFQYVIVDCPPSLAPQVRLFLHMADCYILPSIPDRVSVRGAQALCNRLASVGYKTPALGMLWTLFRGQVERHRQTVSLAEKRATVFANLPKAFKTIVPNSADIVRSLDENDADVRSFTAKYRTGAEVFEHLCDEIVTRLRTRTSEKLPAKETQPIQGPRRYHGTFRLDAERAGRDAGKVAERILSHLTVVDDAKVKAYLEVDAEFSKGASAETVQRISQNARTLSAISQGFEN